MLSLIFIALGMWYISILIFLCAVAFFFSLTGLVKKFGNSFLEKLTAYYTVDTFKTIRVNRKVENIVKKRNAKNNI